MMDIKTVGVLGCGLMGSGIAQVCATAGFDVVALEIEQKYLIKVLPESGVAGKIFGQGDAEGVSGSNFRAAKRHDEESRPGRLRHHHRGHH